MFEAAFLETTLLKTTFLETVSSEAAVLEANFLETLMQMPYGAADTHAEAPWCGGYPRR